MLKTTAKTIEAFIQQSPKETQAILKKVLEIVRKNAPKAEESISYMMPAFKLHGKPLVYFAPMKNHLGFYATPSGNAAFKKELINYVVGKGSVQFPYDEPIPYDLIKKIVQFRVKEVETKYGKKKN